MRLFKKSNFLNLEVEKDGTLDTKKLPVFIQYLTNLDSDVSSLFRALQGQLRLATASNHIGENIFGYEVSVSDTGGANVEFSASHLLQSGTIGIVPTRFLVTSIDKGGVIYKSATTWTTTTVYFKCSAANVNVKIFLLP